MKIHAQVRNHSHKILQDSESQRKMDDTYKIHRLEFIKDDKSIIRMPREYLKREQETILCR